LLGKRYFVNEVIKIPFSRTFVRLKRLRNRMITKTACFKVTSALETDPNCWNAQ